MLTACSSLFVEATFFACLPCLLLSAFSFFRLQHPIVVIIALATHSCSSSHPVYGKHTACLPNTHTRHTQCVTRLLCLLGPLLFAFCLLASACTWAPDTAGRTHHHSSLIYECVDGWSKRLYIMTDRSQRLFNHCCVFTAACASWPGDAETCGRYQAISPPTYTHAAPR